ncbi:MAG TPA: pyridoxal-phosphate dependent enzyme [Gammaproteobacteria bacterium]|nr:pyridoxal-phosphate dependent enzyme [Gammaproteobacteria bacterium]
MIAAPTLATVREAAARIAPYAARTPVFTSATLDARAGARVFCKAENLQRAGAFKFRGAANAVFSLDEEAAAGGVATHSSGNHGAALALAARLRGVRARVVMPDNATAAKRAAVAGYGAEIIACRPGLASRERALVALVADSGAACIHPYDDYRVIAGQGTAALELLEAYPDLDTVVVPVGGGGLLSGTAVAGKGLNPDLRIIGVEPRQADDARRSLEAGRRIVVDAPETVADGLRASLGERTFAIIRTQVDDIVCVDEADIIAAMRFVWERMKLVVEPSAAVAVAALLAGLVPGKRIGIVLSGGNVDLDAALTLMRTAA